MPDRCIDRCEWFGAVPSPRWVVECTRRHKEVAKVDEHASEIGSELSSRCLWSARSASARTSDAFIRMSSSCKATPSAHAVLTPRHSAIEDRFQLGTGARTGSPIETAHRGKARHYLPGLTFQGLVGLVSLSFVHGAVCVVWWRVDAVHLQRLVTNVGDVVPRTLRHENHPVV